MNPNEVLRRKNSVGMHLRRLVSLKSDFEVNEPNSQEKSEILVKIKETIRDINYHPSLLNDKDKELVKALLAKYQKEESGDGTSESKAEIIRTLQREIDGSLQPLLG
jgi:hypothetical protein